MGSSGQTEGMRGFFEAESLSVRALFLALGGVRGAIEAFLPGTLFVTVLAIGSSLTWALAISVGVALALVIARLVARSLVRSAVAGFIGLGLSAILALVTGRAQDNFLPALWINASYAVAMLLSLLVGWPAIGLVLGAFTGSLTGWRTVRAQYRMAQLLTLLWLALFCLRLIVQVPLYLAENATGLGIAHIVMGTPLYALFVVLTWFGARSVFFGDTRRGDTEIS